MSDCMLCLDGEEGTPHIKMQWLLMVTEQHQLYALYKWNIQMDQSEDSEPSSNTHILGHYKTLQIL